MRRDKFEDERGSSGSGGGSSWISYSDMMASLLLVFLLMLCVSLLQYFTAPKQEDLDKQAAIEERIKDVEKREAELKELEEKLKEKETSLNEREAQITEREKAATEKEAKLAEAEAALKAAQEQLEKDQEALKAVKEQMEKDREVLQAEQEQFKKDQEALKAAQEQLEKDQEALKAAQEQLEKDQETLKTVQEQLEKDQEALKAAQEQFKRDQEQLEKDREQLEKERAELETEKKQLEEDRAALETEKKQLQEEKEALKAAQEQLKKDQEALKAEQEQFKKDQEQLEKDREQLQKDQEALKTAQKQLKQDQEQLQKDREQLEKEKQALKAQQDELEKRLKEIGTPTPASTPEPTPTVDPAELERQRAELQELQEQKAAMENYVVRSSIISNQFSAFSGSGLQINIDPDTGEIVLANSILFDAGSDVLRPEGKAFLNEFIPLYLDVLMKPEYEGYISEVIIEGHTDTNGAYFGNLSLSQARASNVMEYSLKVPGLSKQQKAYLQAMVSATGRGSADPVYDEAGNVDMDACRRVEFKFRMKETGALAGTGIIEELTRALGESGLEVSIDEDTGDIQLNSTIMFDTNSAEVKAEGREFIRKFLPIYLDVLMKPEYEEYIGVIIIEGYTDNKGTYVANLGLSQRRATNVMKICLEVDLTNEQKEFLRKKISATGRSYANLIYKENGKVDLEASRRVVFKFRLKDTKSLEELKKMLQETSKEPKE